MAKKGIVALMACAFALCLALVGCGGGGGNNATNNKAAFVGTWDLVEMNQDGQVTGSEDLETLKSLGLEVYVNFNEDGTMVLALFGEPLDGTWEATSSTEGTISMEGQTADMSISDSKLTFEQEGASLTFEKGEAKEAPSSSSAVEEESATVEEESSAATEPEAAEPEATEPEATEPEAAEPEATEPEATEPEAAEPEAAESEVAETTESEAAETESAEAVESEATESESAEAAESESAEQADSEAASEESAESESSTSSAAE